jgi:RNA ligase (TIGR02306 family)
MGIVLSIPDAVGVFGESIKEIPFDIDCSGNLSIQKYEPPIPAQLAGNVKVLNQKCAHQIRTHDVLPYASNAAHFTPEDDVIVTEKLHGSQMIMIWLDNVLSISSKGLNATGLVIEKSDTNLYWRAAKEIGLEDFLGTNFSGVEVRMFGEVLPCQSGFTYGVDSQHPTVKFFRLFINQIFVPYENAGPFFTKHWVPIVYKGKYDAQKIQEMKTGTENVSGKSYHIREGVVLSHIVERYDHRGNHAMMVKLINPKYKEDDENIN